MQHQVYQEEKKEQGSNDGSQECYARNGETGEKPPSDSNTKVLEPILNSAEPTTQRTNNESYELLTQLQRMAQTETACISGMISEIRDQLGDDEDNTGDSDSGYSDRSGTDDESQSDYGNVKYSTESDSTGDGNSDGYSTDEYRGRSRGRSKGRKNTKVASKSRLSTPPKHRGRFPISVASRNN